MEGAKFGDPPLMTPGLDEGTGGLRIVMDLSCLGYAKKWFVWGIFLFWGKFSGAVQRGAFSKEKNQPGF